MSIAPFIARYWPFANGSGRIIDNYAKNVSLGRGVRTTQASDGFSIQVLAEDLIGRHILLSGKFDRSIVQVLLDQARPGDTLLDIGANIGYVSACFLTLVSGSRVICVEPQPGIIDILRHNMAQFGDRSEVHAAALSDKPGELRFHIDWVNRGASKISEDGEIVIPALDGAILLASMERVDLIKIDVEGHEEQVLRAIEDQLRRLMPRAIVFEDQGLHAAPQGKIGAILGRAGYRVLGIDKQLFQTRLVPVHSKTDCRFNDYLALR
jgi:FkbM family methyltransferase